ETFLLHPFKHLKCVLALLLARNVTWHGSANHQDLLILGGQLLLGAPHVQYACPECRATSNHIGLRRNSVVFPLLPPLILLGRLRVVLESQTAPEIVSIINLTICQGVPTCLLLRPFRHVPHPRDGMHDHMMRFGGSK